MPDQNSNPDFLESQSYEGEKKAFEDRRKAVFPAESLTRRPWGLALSGGGIRSATFSLGVLQSLARAPNSPDAGNGAPPLLARFDYLSTVSGGGYTGAFLSSLFRLAGSRGAPTVTNATDVDLSSAKEQSDRAYEALAIEPPGRMTAETTSKTLDHPLRWLRENGRYMAPAGAGDMFYAISLQIRNWCAVHYVIGITLLFAFLTGLSLRSIAQVSQVNTNLGGWPAKMEAFLQPDHANGIWWSPWFWLALAVLALAVVPVGVSYWLTYRPKPNASDLKKHFPPSVLAAIALVALTAILATLAIGSGAAVFLFSFFGWVAASIVIAISLFWFSGSGGAVSAQRVTLTHWLTAACVTALVLVVLGLVETVSQSLYLLLHQAGRSPASAISAFTAAAATALSLIKTFVESATNRKPDGLASKIPPSAIMGLIAAALIMIVAISWHLLALLLFFSGGDPRDLHPSGAGAMIAVALASRDVFVYHLMLLVVTAAGLLGAGYFVGFLNLSSLATLYSARLTRAYLGASNPKRFEAGGSKLREVAEPDPSDDFKPGNYYQTSHLGPLHLINVTINCTTGSEGRLTQLDRKGIPLAITPNGLSVNGGSLIPFSGKGAGDDLTIGQWIGISGAAFSPGIGRGTSLGMAALCTLANVRLGYWWGSPRKRDTFGSKLAMLARTQRYLLREMTGRFFGISRHFWYLSDGGHFENTGVYELLRRRCELIVTCDDGADASYQFEDLANLMRLARIDFGADFSVVPPAHAIDEFKKAGLALGTNASASLANGPADLSKGSGATAHCGIAYRVTYRDFPDQPTLFLVVKPRLIQDAPLDLIQYQATHPTFPQESTLDQFYDEAQWESYRKLGALTGERLFLR